MNDLKILKEEDVEIIETIPEENDPLSMDRFISINYRINEPS